MTNRVRRVEKPGPQMMVVATAPQLRECPPSLVARENSPAMVVKAVIRIGVTRRRPAWRVACNTDMPARRRWLAAEMVLSAAVCGHCCASRRNAPVLAITAQTINAGPMLSSRHPGFSPCTKPMSSRANPEEATTDWRAVCGRTACTVPRAGRASALPDPYPRSTSRRGTARVWSACYAMAQDPPSPWNAWRKPRSRRCWSTASPSLGPMLAQRWCSVPWNGSSASQRSSRPAGASASLPRGPRAPLALAGAELTPQTAKPAGCAATEQPPLEPHTVGRHHASARYLWAMLLARSYAVFPLVCPHCGTEMRISWPWSPRRPRSAACLSISASL
jgi:hypothetical protein